MTSLNDFARAKLAQLEAQQLRRYLTETVRMDGIHVVRGGRKLVSFCCNDYLGLSHHPSVRQAAMAAIETYGTGSGASRLVTGNHPLLAALEARLAAYKDTETSIVFGSGYLANLGIIGALAGPGDLVLLDALSHACMHAGGRIGGAAVQIFRHNDVAHLADLLDEARGRFRHILIATEHVFSMDGDLAPVAVIAAAARAYDAWLLVDDAHGMGILPMQGQEQVPLRMGTLSKALASYGGYLAASQPVVELLHGRARSFVYSTGLPPASAAAALASLDLIEADPAWAGSPLEHARRFARLLNLPPPQSQIVPIIFGDAARALAVSATLERAGYLVAAIRPPTVPEGTARLRLTFSAAHSEAQIDGLAEAVRPLLPGS